MDVDPGAESTRRRSMSATKVPLQCTNVAFDEWLRRRREIRKDFLAEQRVSGQSTALRVANFLNLKPCLHANK